MFVLDLVPALAPRKKCLSRINHALNHRRQCFFPFFFPPLPRLTLTPLDLSTHPLGSGPTYPHFFPAPGVFFLPFSSSHCRPLSRVEAPSLFFKPQVSLFIPFTLQPSPLTQPSQWPPDLPRWPSRPPALPCAPPSLLPASEPSLVSS